MVNQLQVVHLQGNHPKPKSNYICHLITTNRTCNYVLYNHLQVMLALIMMQVVGSKNHYRVSSKALVTQQLFGYPVTLFALYNTYF